MRYELPRSQDRAIWDIWLSMHQLPALAVADELGIFQALEERPATAPETAQRLGLNARAAGVLFSMLGALGLLILRDGRHELADVARTYLLPQSAFYWGPLLRALGVLPLQHTAMIRALRAPDEGMVGPAPLANEKTRRPLPSDAWSRGQSDRAQAEAVTRVMHCHSLPASIGAARSGLFDGVSRLLDVGGGSGCFSIAIAQRLPRIRCTVMELSAVCEVARRYVEEGGASERVDTVAVDMFREPWPRGYDGILFSNVFHDWGVDTNLFLARCAHEALPRGGRILLHEMLLAADGYGPLTTAAFSMLMLFGTRGRQYSLSELSQILTDAGFTDIDACETYGYYSVVSARKP